MATNQQISARLMNDLQRDLELTRPQASGVVGSGAVESGGFNTLQEISPTVSGSRGGFGYFQWTGPRRRSFEQFARDNSLDPTSYEANYGFLLHEIENDPYERSQFEKIRQTNTAADAARVFTTQFLRPAASTAHMDRRQAEAETALGAVNQLGGGNLGTNANPQAYAAPTPASRPPASPMEGILGQMRSGEIDLDQTAQTPQGIFPQQVSTNQMFAGLGATPTQPFNSSEVFNGQSRQDIMAGLSADVDSRSGQPVEPFGTGTQGGPPPSPNLIPRPPIPGAAPTASSVDPRIAAQGAPIPEGALQPRQAATTPVRAQNPQTQAANSALPRSVSFSAPPIPGAPQSPLTPEQFANVGRPSAPPQQPSNVQNDYADMFSNRASLPNPAGPPVPRAIPQRVSDARSITKFGISPNIAPVPATPGLAAQRTRGPAPVPMSSRDMINARARLALENQVPNQRERNQVLGRTLQYTPRGPNQPIPRSMPAGLRPATKTGTSFRREAFNPPTRAKSSTVRAPAIRAPAKTKAAVRRVASQPPKQNTKSSPFSHLFR